MTIFNSYVKLPEGICSQSCELRVFTSQYIACHLLVVSYTEERPPTFLNMGWPAGVDWPADAVRLFWAMIGAVEVWCKDASDHRSLGQLGTEIGQPLDSGCWWLVVPIIKCGPPDFGAVPFFFQHQEVGSQWQGQQVLKHQSVGLTIRESTNHHVTYSSSTSQETKIRFHIIVLSTICIHVYRAQQWFM